MKQEWLFNSRETNAFVEDRLGTIYFTNKRGSAMKRLYTVYDTVSCTIIGAVIQELNDAPAIRAFTDALGAKDSFLSQHPSDYNLLYLGSIDDQGEILPVLTPEVILRGQAWKEMQNG